MHSIVQFFLGLFYSSPHDHINFIIELIAASTGIISVYMIAKEHILGWPIGIINIIGYVYICWKNNFYSDMILYAIFLPMQIYGWAYWLRGGLEKDKTKEFTVFQLNSTQIREWYLSGLIITFLWGFVFDMAGKAGWIPAPALPYHDAATTVISLIAQYLMARQFIECWLLWIAVDILSPMNYITKDLIPTAVFYLVLLWLASVGFKEWKKTLDKQKAAAAPKPATT